jgi:putative dimethyl sulfoxide reductase chaperone
VNTAQNSCENIHKKEVFLVLTDQTPIHTQFQPLFQSRKNLYQLLQLLFSEQLLGEPLFELKRNEEVQILLSEMNEGGRILHRFFERLSEEQISRESEEYRLLFLGPGPLAAPPWESFYRSREQLLFETWTYKVREQYHQFGLQFVKENNEPDDHLLIELEFMTHLCNQLLQEKEAAGISMMIESQMIFLENHLTKWIPHFCMRLIDHTNSQLYLGSAMLLDEFIQFDSQSLIEVKEALNNV